MDAARVQIFEPCPQCLGQGIASHPVYDTFYEATRQWRADHPPRPGEPPADYQARAHAFDVEWMARAGWPGGPRRWPPEERTCPLCDGEGEIPRRVDLRDLPQMMGLTGLTTHFPAPEQGDAS